MGQSENSVASNKPMHTFMALTFEYRDKNNR